MPTRTQSSLKGRSRRLAMRRASGSTWAVQRKSSEARSSGSRRARRTRSRGCGDCSLQPPCQPCGAPWQQQIAGMCLPRSSLLRLRQGRRAGGQMLQAKQGEQWSTRPAWRARACLTGACPAASAAVAFHPAAATVQPAAVTSQTPAAGAAVAAMGLQSLLGQKASPHHSAALSGARAMALLQPTARPSCPGQMAMAQQS